MKERIDSAAILLCQCLVWLCLFGAAYFGTLGNEAGVIACVLGLCGFVGLVAAIVVGRGK